MVQIYNIQTDEMVEVTQELADFYLAMNDAIGTYLAPICPHSSDPWVVNAWEKFVDVVGKALPHA